MPSARVLAQAKINLALRVLAREASGYHQIETLFQRIALGDAVHVRAWGVGEGGSGGRNARSLDMSGRALPAEGVGPVEQNLAWRAALAFAEAARWPAGFAIEVEKEIPVGGGLGGGSADAGAVLRALNTLAPHPLGDAALLALATRLGADVPFLTQARSPLALAWGRGERMLPLEPLPARRCFLVRFPFGVPTADAYGWIAAAGLSVVPGGTYSREKLREWDYVKSISHNDFEDAVVSRYPLLRRALEVLRHEGASGAVDLVRMSGSGATAFALGAVAEAVAGDGSGAGAGSGNTIRNAPSTTARLNAAPPIHPVAGDTSTEDAWCRTVEESIGGGVRVVATSTASHVEPVVRAD